MSFQRDEIIANQQEWNRLAQSNGLFGYVLPTPRQAQLLTVFDRACDDVKHELGIEKAAVDNEARRLREFDWNRAFDLEYLQWWYLKEISLQ